MVDPVSGPDSEGKPEEIQQVTPLLDGGLNLPQPTANRGHIDLHLMSANEFFVYTAAELHKLASKHGPLALNRQAIFSDNSTLTAQELAWQDRRAACACRLLDELGSVHDNPALLSWTYRYATQAFETIITRHDASSLGLIPTVFDSVARAFKMAALANEPSRPIGSGYASKIASTILLQALDAQSEIPSAVFEGFRSQIIEAVPPVLIGVVKDLKERCDDIGIMQALGAVCEVARLLNAPELAKHFEHEDLNLKQFQREINRIHGYSQADKDAVREARRELRFCLAVCQKDQDDCRRWETILDLHVDGNEIAAFGQFVSADQHGALQYLMKACVGDSSDNLDSMGHMCLEFLRKVEGPEQLALTVTKQGPPFIDLFKFYLTHALFRTLEIDTTIEDRQKFLIFVDALKECSQTSPQ